MGWAWGLWGLSIMTGTASAQDVTLEYVVAEGCPDEAWLRAEVVARLGRDPFVVDESRPSQQRALDADEGGAAADMLVARVTTEREARRWRGVLDLRDTRHAHGRRVLEDDDCRELTAALALSLAMALEAVDVRTEDAGVASPSASTPSVSGTTTTSATESGTNSTSPPDPSAARTTAASTTPPRELVVRFELHDDADTAMGDASTAAPTQAAREARGATPLQVAAIVRAGAAIGHRPAVAPRLELALALRRARFVLELGGAFGPPTRSEVAGRSLRTHDGEAHLAPCVRVFELWDLCGIAAVGRIATRASNDRVPRAWTASMGMRTEVAWPVAERVALTFALDLRANLRRPSVVSSDETLWRAAPLRGALTVGLRWRLPMWGARTDSRASTQAPSGDPPSFTPDGGRGWRRLAWTTRSGA